MSRRIVSSLSILVAAGALAAGAQSSEARVQGHAWNTGPGGATRVECVGYADAINDLLETASIETEPKNQAEVTKLGGVIVGLLKASKARGCTMLGDPVV